MGLDRSNYPVINQTFIKLQHRRSSNYSQDICTCKSPRGTCQTFREYFMTLALFLAKLSITLFQVYCTSIKGNVK